MAKSGQYSYATAQTVIEVGIETTKGTAASTKFAVPVKAPKYKVSQAVLDDDSIEGTMAAVYGQTNGMRYDGHGWDGFPYLDKSFPVFARAELGSTDLLTTAPVTTALSTAAAAAASIVKTKAAVAAGSWIVIGAGATMETHRVKSVATTTKTLTLTYPLVYAQAATAPVKGLTGHSFSLLNGAGQGDQPPSCTIWDFDGERCRQLLASQLDQLTVKGNATGFVEYTTSWFANPAIKVTEPTPTWSSEAPPPGWTFVASLGGVQLAVVETWQVDLKRGVKPVPALTGSQEFFQYFAGPIQATGKLVFIEQTGSPIITDFVSTATKSLDIQLYDTTSGYALQLHTTKTKFKAAEIDRSQEWVRVSSTFQMLPSATDAVSGGGGRSPIKVTVANAQTTQY